VQGGGIQPGYEARLQVDGKTYPSNPSIPPALPEAGKVEGKVVITPLQEGILLFRESSMLPGSKQTMATARQAKATTT
jgi:hypothetical protein